MNHRQILVVGGSGFIGSHVVAQLAAQGCKVIVPTRHRERARHLLLLPRVDVIEAQVSEPGVLEKLAQGCDAAISLVGILHGRAAGPDWGTDFNRAHVELPRLLVKACAAQGVRRLVHVSALGVTEGGERTLPSRYLRSKAAGEAVIRTAPGLDWTVLRPSVVFGADDAFMNVFARLQALLPLIGLAGSTARFQPVWVADVAQAVVNVLDAPQTHGKVYPLVGPEVFTLRQLVELAGLWTGHSKPIIGLPGGIDRLVAMLMELAPGEPMMSRDNIDSMSIDNVSDAPLAPELGIKPASLRELGPSLYGGGIATRFSRLRERAGR
jgi:NADH dehydrogenase